MDGRAASPLSASEASILLQEEAGQRLEWMREAAMCLDPHDTVLSPYMQPILEPLLARLREATKGQHASQCRTLAHIVNSILHQIQRQ